MSVETFAPEVLRTRLADLLELRIDRLVSLWAALGPAGPGLGSDEVGPPDQARDRYFHPLARLLVGALRGSASHLAVYLDERQRYVDPGLDAPGRARVLHDSMAVELPAVAGLLEPELSHDAVLPVLEDLHDELIRSPDRLPAARALFIGDCVFVETRALLVPTSRQQGHPVDVRHVFFSARQPLESTNTAIVEEMKGSAPQVVGLSLFTFDGIPPWSAAWTDARLPFRLGDADQVAASLAEVVRETVEDIRSVSDCPIVVHSPGGLPLGPVRRRLGVLPPHSRAQRRLLDAVATALAEVVAGTENTLLLDERDLVAQGRGLRQMSRPLFDPADVPPGYAHPSRLGEALASYYDDLVGDLQLLSGAKALFVDFDNTLWRGVMGEGDVVHDLEGQRLLKELEEAGVLLVALSKNDPTSIRWDEMALAPEDFVLHKIGWSPKPDNVSAAIKELDLAPEAFVLLDDNPVERALVSEQVAGVRSLDPGRPETWRALRRWLQFPSTKQTEESRRRTAMYREAAERRAAMGMTHDYPTMMRSLGLRYSVREACRTDIPRLLELIQRTNQFNTTTLRHTRAEIEALLEDPAYGVHVASMRDRFGDLGVVAVVVFDCRTRTFDSVIMSCRAMGFGLEVALLREVMQVYGPGPYTGLFRSTPRNSPAADLFGRAGFVETSPGRWTLSGGQETWPSIPEWLAPA